MEGIDEIINNLYNQTCEICELSKTDDQKIQINKEEIEKALQAIYDDFDCKTEIEERLFNQTLEHLNKATDAGFMEVKYEVPDNAFLQEIKTNNAVFAAFKTHRQQNELAEMLLDDDNKLKSFVQFKKDSERILTNYNQNWLQTEYNTAITRARTARQFKQFESEKHLFPNIEWLPSLSANPREAHKSFYHRVWAQNDPFWDNHTPGALWGCKCSARSTDTPVSTGNLPREDSPDPAQGLDNNPAKDACLFSKTHPYFKNTYSGAKKAVADFIEDKLPYKIAKEYKNGGQVRIYKEMDPKASDYKPIYNICNQFAKEGKVCEMTPRIHIKDARYKEVYGDLIGTKYEGKCPDFRADGVWYEHEGFKSSNPKRAVGNMLSRGLAQSNKIVIDDCNISDRYLHNNILSRTNKEKQDIAEVWILKGNKAKLFYKKTEAR